MVLVLSCIFNIKKTEMSSQAELAAMLVSMVFNRSCMHTHVLSIDWSIKESPPILTMVSSRQSQDTDTGCRLTDLLEPRREKNIALHSIAGCVLILHCPVYHIYYYYLLRRVWK